MSLDLKVTYTVVDKNPIRLGYGLKMTYKELTLQQADILMPSMNILGWNY